MSLEEPESMQWTAAYGFGLNPTSHSSADYQVHQAFAPSSDFYHYAQNGLAYNDNINLAYASRYTNSSCPRSYGIPDLTGLPANDATSGAYPPAAYQIEPQGHHDLTTISEPGLNDHLMQISDDYEHYYGAHIKQEDDGGYLGPYSDITRPSTPSTPGDDLPKYPRDDGGELGALDKEQPYAQLIYKALLEADNHTMILRDIYDWFKKHTDKASASETKGWQNSIRHNLSMNGAFEKVDHPYEDSRKGYMWRLSKDALRDGVKSTTRYRSKQPNKRAHRNQQPQPQRQASGAKGGQAARRSANLRRSKRMNEHYRSEPYIARSVPAAFDPAYYTETSMQYPSSPLYGSDVDFTYPIKADPHEFGNPLMGNALDLFSSARSYTGSPLAQGMTMGDTAYVLDQNASEPLFTDSPSPPANDPRTPHSSGGWNE
ncbi:hypothetical protein FB567DRAFT_403295, partial [Paraphoma chrysanthemicola]